jgi:hypothetical protein
MRHLTNVRALAIWIVLFLLTRTTLASPKQNEPMNNRGDHGFRSRQDNPSL